MPVINRMEKLTTVGTLFVTMFGRNDYEITESVIAQNKSINLIIHLAVMIPRLIRWVKNQFSNYYLSTCFYVNH